MQSSKAIDGETCANNEWRKVRLFVREDNNVEALHFGRNEDLQGFRQASNSASRLARGAATILLLFPVYSWRTPFQVLRQDRNHIENAKVTSIHAKTSKCEMRHESAQSATPDGNEAVTGA